MYCSRPSRGHVLPRRDAGVRSCCGTQPPPWTTLGRPAATRYGGATPPCAPAAPPRSRRARRSAALRLRTSAALGRAAATCLRGVMPARAPAGACRRRGLLLSGAPRPRAAAVPRRRALMLRRPATAVQGTHPRGGHARSRRDTGVRRCWGDPRTPWAALGRAVATCLRGATQACTPAGATRHRRGCHSTARRPRTTSARRLSLLIPRLLAAVDGYRPLSGRPSPGRDPGSRSRAGRLPPRRWPPRRGERPATSSAPAGRSRRLADRRTQRVVGRPREGGEGGGRWRPSGNLLALAAAWRPCDSDLPTPPADASSQGGHHHRNLSIHPAPAAGGGLLLYRLYGCRVLAVGCVCLGRL